MAGPVYARARPVLRALWVDGPAGAVDPGGVVWRACVSVQRATWNAPLMHAVPVAAPGAVEALSDVRRSLDHGGPGRARLLGVTVHTRGWCGWGGSRPPVEAWRRALPPATGWIGTRTMRAPWPSTPADVWAPVLRAQPAWHTAVVTNDAATLHWARMQGVWTLSIAEASAHVADVWARAPQWGPASLPTDERDRRLRAATAALYAAGARQVVPSWAYVPFALRARFSPVTHMV